MSQFVADSQYAEVRSDFIDKIVNVMEIGKEFRIKIVEAHGVDLNEASKEDSWIKLQMLLDIYKEILNRVGERTLFMIGTISGFENWLETLNLKEGLLNLNTVCKQLHRSSFAHWWFVNTYDSTKRYASISSKSPYPSELERGMLMAILRKLRPMDSSKYTVEIDTTSEDKKNGGNSTTYILKW